MSDFKAIMHQNRFRLGLRPRSKLTVLPRPPSWILGALLLREAGYRKGEEGGEAAEGRGKKGRGG